LHGERDTEYQFGVSVPIVEWSLDVDSFRNTPKTSSITTMWATQIFFFPLTINEGLISRME